MSYSINRSISNYSQAVEKRDARQEAAGGRNKVQATKLDQLLIQMGLIDESCHLSDVRFPPYPNMVPEIKNGIHQFFNSRIIEGSALTYSLMVIGLQEALKLHGFAFTFLHRGSHARALMAPFSQIESVINYRMNVKNPVFDPQSADSCWKEIRKGLPTFPPPNDIDWIAYGQFTVDDLLKLRQIVADWFLKIDPSLKINIIVPLPNQITTTSQPLFIVQIGDSCDLVFGCLDEKRRCLFSIDALAIQYSYKGFGLVAQNGEFWQSVVDSCLKIVRVQKHHKDDFRAVLAALNHQMNGYRIVEEGVTLLEISELFFGIAAASELCNAIKSRYENHGANPLALTINTLLLAPQEQHEKVETIWKGIVGRNETWNGIDLREISFKQFVSELYYFTECVPNHPILKSFPIFFPLPLPPLKEEERHPVIRGFFEKKLLFYIPFAQPQISSNNPYSNLFYALSPKLGHDFPIELQRSIAEVIEGANAQDQKDIQSLFGDKLRVRFPITKMEFLETLLKSDFATTQTVELWKEHVGMHQPEEVFRALVEFLKQKPELLRIEFKKLVSPGFKLLSFLITEKVISEKLLLEALNASFSQVEKKTRFKRVATLPPEYQYPLLVNEKLFDASDAESLLLNLLRNDPSHELYWKIEMRGINVPANLSSEFIHKIPPRGISQVLLNQRLYYLAYQRRYEELSLLLPLVKELPGKELLAEAIQNCKGRSSYELLKVAENRGVRFSNELKVHSLLQLDDSELYAVLEHYKDSYDGPESVYEQVAITCLQTERFSEEQRSQCYQFLLSKRTTFHEKATLNRKVIPFLKNGLDNVSLKGIEGEIKNNPKEACDYLDWLLERGATRQVIEMIGEKWPLLEKPVLLKLVQKVIPNADGDQLVRLSIIDIVEIRAVVSERIHAFLLSLGLKGRIHFIAQLNDRLQRKYFLDETLFDLKEVEGPLLGLLQRTKDLLFAWELETRGVSVPLFEMESWPLPRSLTEAQKKSRLRYLKDAGRIGEAIDCAERVQWPYLERFVQVCLNDSIKSQNLRDVLQIVSRCKTAPELDDIKSFCMQCSDAHNASLLLNLFKILSTMPLKREIPALIASIHNHFTSSEQLQQAIVLTLNCFESSSNESLPLWWLDGMNLNKEWIAVLTPYIDLIAQEGLKDLNALIPFVKLWDDLKGRLPSSLSENFFRHALECREWKLVLKLFKAFPNYIPLFRKKVLELIAINGDKNSFLAWKAVCPAFDQEEISLMADRPEWLLELMTSNHVASIVDALVHSDKLTCEMVEKLLNRIPKQFQNRSFLDCLFERFPEQHSYFMKWLLKRRSVPIYQEMFVEKGSNLVRQRQVDWLLDQPALISELNLDQETMAVGLAELFPRLLKNGSISPQFFLCAPIECFNNFALLSLMTLPVDESLKAKAQEVVKSRLRSQIEIIGNELPIYTQFIFHLLKNGDLENDRDLFEQFYQDARIPISDRWKVHKTYLKSGIVFNKVAFFECIQQKVTIEAVDLIRFLAIQSVDFKGDLNELAKERDLIKNCRAAIERKLFVENSFDLVCMFCDVIRAVNLKDFETVDRLGKHIYLVPMSQVVTGLLIEFVKDFPEHYLVFLLNEEKYEIFDRHISYYLINELNASVRWSKSMESDFEVLNSVQKIMGVISRLDKFRSTQSEFVIGKLLRLCDTLTKEVKEEAYPGLVRKFFNWSQELVRGLGQLPFEKASALFQYVQNIYINANTTLQLMDHPLLKELNNLTLEQSSNARIRRTETERLYMLKRFNEFYRTGAFGDLRKLTGVSATMFRDWAVDLIGKSLARPSEFHFDQFYKIMDAMDQCLDERPTSGLREALMAAWKSWSEEERSDQNNKNLFVKLLARVRKS